MVSDRKLLSYHIHKFSRDISEHPLVYIAFLNGVFGGMEIFMLIWLASSGYNASVSLLFVGLSQGQLLTALVLDLTAYCWVPRFYPWECTSVGGAAVFLGSIILLLYPMANVFVNPWMFARYFASFGAGIFSFLSYAFTRRISYSFMSYWAGTSTAALGQVIVLLCLCFGLDPNGSSVPIALFQESNLITVFICALFALLVGSATVQFYGDTGGFFSTLGPLVAGQMVLSTCLEISDRWFESEFTRSGDTAKFSGSTVFGLILVIVGSWLMWTGRWTTDSKGKVQYAMQRSVVVAIPVVTAPEIPVPDLNEEINEQQLQPPPLPSLEGLPKSAHHRISICPHPAAQRDRQESSSRQVSAASTPRYHINQFDFADLNPLDRLGSQESMPNPSIPDSNLTTPRHGGSAKRWQFFRPNGPVENHRINGIAGRVVNGQSVNETTGNGTEGNGTEANGTEGNGTEGNGVAVNEAPVNGTGGTPLTIQISDNPILHKKNQIEPQPFSSRFDRLSSIGSVSSFDELFTSKISN